MGASLVVLAAGMGSRYGGLKQIDEFGPHGESLLEYAVYDALRAGFNHIVLIIRKEFEDAFVEKFADMLAACPSYDLVYQNPDPRFDFIETVDREKPWGTLHATLCAAEVVNQPFAVVNADDRYGNTSYDLIYEQLTQLRHDEALLVGYVLGNTLSNHGTVNRGVCDINTEKMTLQDVKEHYAIGYTETREIADRDGNVFSGDEIVSMNFFGFHPEFFRQVQPLFELFVRVHKDDSKKEMVIPDGVDVLVKQGNLTCRVLQSKDSRQGVTNPEDKEKVQNAFDAMIQNGVYPDSLWSV